MIDAMPCGPRPHRGVSIARHARARQSRPRASIYYAPAENLEHIDVALIDGAQHEIDMAAYVLTDWSVMQALRRAADRGVQIRIYLDGTQLGEREPAKVFNYLAETPGVDRRTKIKRFSPFCGGGRAAPAM